MNIYKKFKNKWKLVKSTKNFPEKRIYLGHNVKFPSLKNLREVEYLKIGDSAKIDPDVIFKGNCEIGSNTTIKHSTIINDTFIGKNCLIKKGAILNKACNIHNNCIIGEKTKLHIGCILHHRCIISDESILRSNSVLLPETKTKVWLFGNKGDRTTEYYDAYLKRTVFMVFVNSKIYNMDRDWMKYV